MHEERDHLVRHVFPELRERLQALRVNLIDVDLRWGVSERDVQEGLTVDICLDEIDTCRPYFLGILGHRYGWIPAGATQSITAQEIFYAVLHGSVPRRLSDLDRFVRDGIPGGFAGADERDLRAAYLPDPERSVHLLRPDLAPDQTARLKDIFRRVAADQRRRSLIFFRKASLSRRMAEARPDDGPFFETDRGLRSQLADLKREIRRIGLPRFVYGDLDTLGRRVLEALTQRIGDELGGRPADPGDPLANESDLHERFVTDRARHFAGRDAELARVESFAAGGNAGALMLVTGTAGCGKSALLAHACNELRRRHPEWLVMPHFVGASPASTSLAGTLRRICGILATAAGETAAPPADLRGLLAAWPDLLRRAGASRRVVVLLDAVNQFDPWDHAQGMDWLPAAWPANVRCIVSAAPGPAVEALARRAPPPARLEVGPLSLAETESFVAAYLRDIRHEFPNAEVRDAFLARVRGGHPLHIRIALEELRVFGRFEELPHRIRALPGDAAALCDQVLERIEGDHARDPALVRDFMAILCCLRSPMPAVVFQSLLRAHAGPLAGAADAVRLPDFWWSRLYRSFRFYLFERGGTIDFFHGQLREAADRRYLRDPADRARTHATLAASCAEWTTAADPHLRAYALRYRIHHLLCAGDWIGVRSLLGDDAFLAAAAQEGCTPAAVLAETARPGAAAPDAGAPAADRIRALAGDLLATATPPARRVALDLCTDLEWLDVLVEAAAGNDGETRLGACRAIFGIYSRRLYRGDRDGAWEGVRILRARVRGPLGFPRGRMLSALVGVLTPIFIECATDPAQFAVLIAEVRDTAWALLPIRRGWPRGVQRAAGRAFLAFFRPGISLGLLALGRLSSAVNLKTATNYFASSRAAREVLRGYFPYLEPRARPMGPLAELVVRHCADRDAFHFNMITGVIASQGAAQPDATLDLLRRMAATGDAMALYEATRGLYYMLSQQREDGRTPAPGDEELMESWLRRFYERPDRVLDFNGARIPNRSLAEHVGDYLAKHAPHRAAAFDALIAGALDTGNTALQADLFDALGIVGQQGGCAFVLERLAPVLQRAAPLDAEARKVLLGALARVYFHWPQAVAHWLDHLPGAALRMEEIVQHPPVESGYGRSQSEQILRRILVREPAMRAVLLRMLDGLPASRSVAGFLQHVAVVLLDLLVDGRPPDNPYA